MTAIGSRVVLALVLFSGGIILTLAALVARPDESHGPTEVAAVASEHEPDEQATEGSSDETVEHADTSEVTNGAESEHEEVGPDQSESAHDDSQSNSVLGVDVESLNLASPWLSIVVIGLTVLLAVGLAIRRSTGLLVACVSLGLVGVAVGVHEATRAGEELGIFVPLPVLASVLYGGAASLAAVVVIAARSDSASAHSTGPGFATSPGDAPSRRSEGAQDV